MDEKKKSRYNYSKGEREINRAFKMQENELSELAEGSERLKKQVNENQKVIDQNLSDIQDLHSQIDELRRKALEIADAKGIKVSEKIRKPSFLCQLLAHP